RERLPDLLHLYDNYGVCVAADGVLDVDVPPRYLVVEVDETAGGCSDSYWALHDDCRVIVPLLQDDRVRQLVPYPPVQLLVEDQRYRRDTLRDMQEVMLVTREHCAHGLQCLPRLLDRNLRDVGPDVDDGLSNHHPYLRGSGRVGTPKPLHRGNHALGVDAGP